MKVSTNSRSLVQIKAVSRVAVKSALATPVSSRSKLSKAVRDDAVTAFHALTEVKQILLNIGATEGNAYGAMFSMPKAKLRTLQNGLIENGFAFRTGSLAVNDKLKVQLKIVAMGSVIGITATELRTSAYTEMALRPIGESLTEDKILPALGDGLKAAAGPLKSTQVKVSGKYNTKVFLSTPSKGRDIAGVLKELDFVVTKLDAQKIVSGVRMEANGKVTFVHYSTLSGVLTVTTNVNDLDV